MSWDDEVGAGAPATIGTGRVASDSGAPLPAEFGTVELVSDMLTPLHDKLTECVGRPITLHVGPGMAATGKLESYADGVCVVDDGREAMTVRADAVLIVQERTR